MMVYKAVKASLQFTTLKTVLKKIDNDNNMSICIQCFSTFTQVKDPQYISITGNNIVHSFGTYNIEYRIFTFTVLY